MAKPKFDYKSKEFLDGIEKLAKQGFTDGEIAVTIGLAVAEFSRKKSQIPQIAQALNRARHTVNSAVRQTYLAVALGKIKTKTVTKRLAEGGETANSMVVYETETEQPPNPQALSTWLFNHDEEWRKKTIEGKKLDVTSGGKELFPEITVEIIDRRDQVDPEYLMK